MYVSSASQIPFIFSRLLPSCMASLILCSMNQAVFCVTPSPRANSQELTPFFALTIIQVAGSHCCKLKGESSNTVPTLTENCFLHPLQSQIRRGKISFPMFRELQRGHEMPLGHRISERNSWQVSTSEK